MALADSHDDRVIPLLDDDDGLDATLRLLIEARGGEAVSADGDSWALPMLDVSSELKQSGGSRDRLAVGDREYAEDWDEQQVVVVSQMVNMCRALVSIATPSRRREKLTQWAFGHDAKVDASTLHSGHDTFQVCCMKLGVRPYVIRAMIHHEWFKHGVTLKALPTSADPVSDGILSEGFLRDFTCGGDVIAAVWMHPSAPMPDLIRVVMAASGAKKERVDDAIATLAQAGLIGLRDGCAWFTGRSPDYLAKRRTSFARSFIESDASTTAAPGESWPTWGVS